LADFKSIICPQCGFKAAHYKNGEIEIKMKDWLAGRGKMEQNSTWNFSCRRCGHKFTYQST